MRSMMIGSVILYMIHIKTKKHRPTILVKKNVANEGFPHSVAPNLPVSISTERGLICIIFDNNPFPSGLNMTGLINIPSCNIIGSPLLISE